LPLFLLQHTAGSLSPPVARGEEVPRQKKAQQPQESQSQREEDKMNNNNNNRVRMLTPHPADFWRLRSPVADQVFITDVTVNLETVTIRECKTEKGFFRDREPTSQIQ